MTVNKRFAEDGDELDAFMDQLVEVLAQTLIESSERGDSTAAIEDLRSENERAIHVIENS
jgi:hypothetical protein